MTTPVGDRSESSCAGTRPSVEIVNGVGARVILRSSGRCQRDARRAHSTRVGDGDHSRSKSIVVAAMDYFRGFLVAHRSGSTKPALRVRFGS
uniref:Uncharacterized protein n=1 Tax=Mycena chlorophos TaxID=658473 RepID=A0ABQ0LHM5_MYCCL|nr:predicted protein [Mycena chlorophos]